MKLAPDVLPPAFYPVGLNLAGRRCVVIGARDDREAIAKARDLRAAGADVAWLDDPSAVREEDVRAVMSGAAQGASGAGAASKIAAFGGIG